MSDFEKSAGELRSQILAIRNEYEDILDAFKAAKKQKTQAKDRYTKCIDEGSEAGLKDCLKTIRECNAVIEGLPTLRESFYGKLTGLEDEYKELMKAARENVQEAEEAMARQKKAVAEAERKREQIHRITSEITGLKNLIVESGEVRKVSED